MEEDYEEDIIQPDEITVQNPLSQKAEPVLTPLGKSQHPLLSDITHIHTQSCIYTPVYGTVYSNAYMGVLCGNIASPKFNSLTFFTPGLQFAVCKVFGLKDKKKNVSNNFSQVNYS